LEIEVREDERPPLRHLDWLEVHVLHGEALDTFHLRRANQVALKIVRPSVIVALQRLALAAPHGDHTGPVQTDVVKAAQRWTVAQYHDSLASDVGSEELPRLGDLLRTPHELPRS